MNGQPFRSIAGLSFALVLAVIGCRTISETPTAQSPTSETPSAGLAGFLNDYTQLKEDKSEEALLLYINPHADFSQYDKILIDPVTIWRGKDSELSDVPAKELDRLASYLQTSMYERLREDFEIVRQPGPGTLQIRTAITQMPGATVPLPVNSSVLAPALRPDEDEKLAAATHAFVDRGAIEGEVLDAVSEERLAAFVDEEAGGQTLRAATGTWSGVEQAYDYWADGLRAGLTAFRRYDEAHH